MGMKPGEQKTQRFKEIHDMIDEVPKFGNDIPEVDYFAREVAYTYSNRRRSITTEEAESRQVCILYLQMYRWADRQERRRMEDMHTHLLQTAFLPSAGKDVKGPTVVATSVSRFGSFLLYPTEHFLIRNFTHPHFQEERDWRNSLH